MSRTRLGNSELELEVHHHRLTNGVSSSIAPIPYLHRATLTVAVRVGSRHEDAANNGISHFLEHMLFRGTPQHPTPFRFNHAVESLGGTLHASTRADFTTFELTLPPEHVCEGISLLSEIFYEPLLRDIELERKIVREEILEALDEDGQDVDADNLAHRALFGEHPLAFKIEGNEDTLESFDDAMLRDWHSRHYVGRNIAIGVAGAFDVREVGDSVARAFEPLQAGAPQIPLPIGELEGEPAFRYVQSSESQADLRIVMPAPGARDPLHPALDLLGRVMDDGMSTRLYRRLVEDSGLAYEAFGGYDAYDDIGIFSVATSVEHSKTVAMLDAVYELLDSLSAGPFEESELEKAKRRAVFQLRSLLDDTESIAEFIATERLFGTERDLAGIAAELDGITQDALRTAAARVLVPLRTQTVVVGALSKDLESRARNRALRYRGR